LGDGLGDASGDALRYFPAKFKSSSILSQKTS
jgi:hypothetical protein